VTVGFYWVEPDEYDDLTYSRVDIDRARIEVRSISAQIASMRPPTS
jgi:hypothetical protein